MKNGKSVWRWLLTAAVVLMAFAPAYAQETVSVVSKLKDLKLKVYGFLETDVISDSTQGLSEEEGNAQVVKRSAYNGLHHRTQMSVRNSRIGFDLSLPKTESGLETQGILELDFMGNNAPNTAPAAAPGAQSERDFFNNPAARVRHAYLNLTYNDWNAKIGQTWSLLGWQPYYFPGEAVVQPGPGQLYRRFAQVRVTHTNHLGEDWTVEQAADMAKPAQMNSGVPEWHGGLRLASTKYKSASSGGAGTSMIPLSIGVSGALIPVRSSTGNANGEAVALDVAIPLIASADGKDKSNNLTLIGEVMSGRGVGGLEYSGLTAGVGGISASGNTVDSGIAGPTKGGMELIRFRAFRSHLQYTLPGGKWAASSGYAQVEARNLDRFTTSSTSLSPKMQFAYASLFYDPLPWLRFAGEFNHTITRYNDTANRMAINNRVQFTTFFTF